MPNTPKPTNRPDMEGIRERVKAATEGPWREGIPGNFRVYGPANIGRQSGPLIQGLGVNDNEVLRANISFIAHARQDIPALIAYIEALERQCEIALHHLQADGALDRRELCELLARDMKALAALGDGEE